MEIASFIIGVIALAVGLMAIPTILQMFFGRPHLVFEADDFTGPEGRILVLKINNPPITNKFFRLCRVEREAGEVMGFFDIQELGTGRIVASTVAGLMQCAPLETMGLSARTLPGFSVGMTVIGTRNGQAQIVDARPARTEPIASGRYVARIVIQRGQDTYRIDQTFRVSDVDHETIWDRRNVVSVRQ